MSYYIFEHSTDTKVIGNVSWDQIELIKPSHAKDLLNNDAVIEVDCLQNKNSVLTDLVSCYRLGINNNFIVSQRLRTIIEKYNIQPHFFTKCTIEKLDNSYIDYSIIHFKKSPFPQMVDFEKSVFRIADSCTFPLTGKEPIVFVNDYAEYTRKKDELFLDGLEIRLDCFTITKDYNDKYDMFSFYPFDSKLFISERLKDELLNNKLSGFDLKKSY